MQEMALYHNRIRDMDNNKKVVTFGEIMLRLAPPEHDRFVQAKSYNASYGGGEANVAVCLANFGVKTSYVSKLPSNEIAQGALNSLRAYGVDTEGIIRGGSRMGIYFLEKGASQRPSKVIYDRAGSAISTASISDFDWDRLLEGASWFHFTGITPALGDQIAEICLSALKTAKDKNITVSCDLNYRKNLWNCQKAGQVMSGLMNYVDVCIANEEDASDVFGIRADKTDLIAGQVDQDAYIRVAEQLTERFDLKLAAITLRESISASDNKWSALLYQQGKHYISQKYSMHIVDRVGGGDSFAAGLIYSQLMDMKPQKAIDFAAAASCLKHSIEGDFNLVTVEEVVKLSEGDGSGRVQR
jgi:2-dehydro-3-deoxygluconokinase